METERMVVARLPPIGSAKGRQISPRHENKYDGMYGAQYTIGGQTHEIPHPQKLKPGQDTHAGALDTWPAHASNNSVGRRANQVALYNSADPPKPRFLEQLESFLSKELKALGVSEVRPSELRLQAHREVFEYLVEDFKTYKPLLSAIKNEYEMMLAYHRQHIRDLEPLKQMLVTVSEQCDQKIVELRDQEKQEMIDLKNENKNLYAHIDKLRQEQKALEMQVEQLQGEVASEYLKYRDECDARKLLIADINDLRYQQEDMLMSKQSMEEITEEKEDPVLMKIALKKAREDIDTTTKRLLEIEANYGDVIPRRDYEALQKQYGILEEQFRIFKVDLVKMQQEHNTLLDVHKQVLAQRDEYYVDAETLRRSATPRPDWSKCIEAIPGGETRWMELCEGKSSDQMVDVLLQELAGGATDGAGAEYFDGQGTGENVPAYLRYEGKVRNRRLGKRDTALLIRDIWREKGAHDAMKSGEKRMKLNEFLCDYLKRRFGLEQMVTEWAYNLHDACQRYQHEESISFFFQVLREEVDEEIYHKQLMMIAKLLNALTKHDLEKGNQGALTRQEFEELLRAFLTTADDESIASLINAASSEMEMAEDETTIEYKNLFMEDDEGKTGPFLEELRKFMNDGRKKYVEDIKQMLGTISPVTVDELKAAVSATDPEIDTADLDLLLCWAYRVSGPSKFPEVEALEQSALIERLNNACLARAGKKPAA